MEEKTDKVTLLWDPNTIRRIVIKVGSRLLTGIENVPKSQRIFELVRVIAQLRERYEIILVSSGAIAAGMKLLNVKKRPQDIARLQSLAALGQGKLIGLYEDAAQQFGFHVGQILLSFDDVSDRQRHLNVRNCIEYLLSYGALPVINENDTVSVEDICFGDNDRLAAMVSLLTHADLTILLTTVDGLHTREPNGELGPRIPLVHQVTEEIERMAGGSDSPDFSVGGMLSKLQAAKMVNTGGIPLIIASGKDFSILPRVIQGEDLGTIFAPHHVVVPAFKRYLTYFADPRGAVVIDEGAANAILHRGKSLLPVGIWDVYGSFEKGDAIEIVNPFKKVIAIGYSNYSSDDIQKIKRHSTQEIVKILGDGPLYEEVVHRNNMAILPHVRVSEWLSEKSIQ